MTKSLSSIGANALGEEMLEILDRDGAVIVEELLPADALSAFNAEIDGILAEGKGLERVFVNETIAGFFRDKVVYLSLSTPREVARKMPTRAQELLGSGSTMTLPRAVAIWGLLNSPRRTVGRASKTDRCVRAATDFALRALHASP